MKYFSFTLITIFIMLSCQFSDKKMAQNTVPAAQEFSKGKQVYDDFCIQCHLPNGEGVPNTFPPLAQSDYLKTKREASISALKYGLSGEIVVNGKTYNGNMTAQGLTDEEIANVMNYITNSWGNKNTRLITAEEVSKVER
ncbi:c-type cytochrome [Lacinutrix sp. Hel_I_90]|uniref:c-type cytochrome n=1 Tax=Lacinutrix sp. Hel_I_90 TaxID=1249999 RepID=UPI000A40BB00|nr:c-type cytochrome [Lacinutrix sp. Hel_I_90]